MRNNRGQLFVRQKTLRQLKTKLIISTLLLTLALTTDTFGQTINMQKLFYNLPINKTAKEIITVLDKNYKSINVAGDRRYFTLTPDSFFNLQPERSEFLVSHKSTFADSSSYEIIVRFVTIKRNNNKKKVSGTYDKIVALFKSEYEYSKPEYIKGTNGKVKVDEWTTYFYNKKDDLNYKFSVTWFDEGKYGHQFIIEYVLN